MSLKNYLFVLIGALILLLTTSQILLINWLQQSFDEKVDIKARDLSERVIELAVDEVFNTRFQPQDPIIQIKHKGGSNQTNQSVTIIEFSEEDVERANEALEKSLKASEKAIKNLANIPELKATIERVKSDPRNEQTLEQVSIEMNSKLLKKEFKVIVDSLHEKSANVVMTKDKALVVKPTSSHHKNIWSFGEISESDTKPLVRSIQISLIIGAIIALLIGYFISNRFNRPLKALAHGFEQVSKGNFDTAIKAQGINEIKTTISHFNAMVVRLQELTAAESQMKESAHLAELGDVSRGLAHALRNPIHTIGLSIEQLLDSSLTPEQQNRLLNTMQQKILGIDKSIKALLMLTTAGIKRDESVPILAVVQDIILEYKTTFSQQVKFSIHIDSHVCLKGSEAEIRNILHTLIINACEANSNNGEVTIKAQQADGKLKIEVIDQGEGLNEFIKEQLFQPHISTKPEGAGMGLYIAQRVARLHYQGEITLNNRESTNGAIATVSLEQKAEK